MQNQDSKANQAQSSQARADLENNSNRFSSDFIEAIQKFDPVFDEPIAKYSTWKIGGPAKILIKTNSSDELAEICLLCDQYGVEFRVVGRISNMLVSDKGFDGVLIVTKDKKIEIHE